MCGILFFDITYLPHDHLATVHRGVASLKHRGPEGSCSKVVSCAGRSHLMAFHRLAVMSPARASRTVTDGETGGVDGMQPFTDSNGSYLVCNGEVYNYLRISLDLDVDPCSLGSDVHILLHALTRTASVTSADVTPDADTNAHVLAIINSIDGEFALVFVDERRVIVARDPLGVRPLFLARDSLNRVIGFASEAKGLIGLPSVSVMEVFPPGHVMISLDGSDYKSFAYHPNPMPAIMSSVSPSTTDHVRNLVCASIEKRLNHSNRPVGILCSGGIDSSIVTALAASDIGLRQKVRVFTIAYASGHSDDTFYANLLCSKCGINLEVVSFDAKQMMECIEPVIRACETYDPNTIRAAIPMYLLAKHISHNTDIKIIISGEGADELFAGYSYLRKAPDAHEINHELNRLLSQLHMFDVLRADRCFAAFGIEVRVPYLDIALVDFVSCLPGEEKTISKHTNFVEKRLLRDAFRETESDVGRFLNVSTVIDRPKERLSDGCGFSFVPHLLTHLSPPHASALQTRLAAESDHYLRIFDIVFGRVSRSLVIPRFMPPWARENNSSEPHLGS